MKKFLNGLILGVACLLFAGNASATTHYVRTDGGTPTQCNGLSDKSYTSVVSDVTHDCALKHLFYVISPRDTFNVQTSVNTKLKGGVCHFEKYDGDIFKSCFLGVTGFFFAAQGAVDWKGRKESSSAEET